MQALKGWIENNTEMTQTGELLVSACSVSQHEITSAQRNNDRTSPQGSWPPSESCQLEIKSNGSAPGGQPWQDMLIAADLPGDVAWPSTPSPQQRHYVELLQAPSCHVQACSPPSARGIAGCAWRPDEL